MLYIGQGGGGDTGMSAPHVFSQAFQVHTDSTDSGSLSPGDGTFGPDAPPTIISGNAATFHTGTHGSFTVTGTGYGPPTFTESGALPGGVTLNQFTGALSGTPTQGGVFPITITASNGASPNAIQAFTLTVDAQPVITSANSTTFTENTPGTFTVTATGTPAPTFSETGPLPTGVTLSSAGVLSGTPTQPGSFPIAIDAANGVSPDATQDFTLTVNSNGTAPTITSTNHATFTQGQPGSFTVLATGSPAATFTETGPLPAGVTLTSGGTLSGTTAQSGTFPITITATNGVSPDAMQSFTLTVTQLFQISTASLPNATLGVAYGPVQLQTIGSGPGATFKWKKAAALPKGLKLVKTGVLQGTPSNKLVSGSNLPVQVQVTETVITFSGKHKIKTKTTVSKTLTLHIN